MAQPLFTVQLAIHRPPHLLPFAVETVLAQTLESFELVIICDGAPTETVEQAKMLAEQDGRIEVRAFPKGARRGEEHRAEVLRTARGRYVAHIADDDFWFPDHLAVLARGLRRFDFCHTIHVMGLPGSPEHNLIARHCDLGVREDWANTAEGKRGFIVPTVAGYRLDAYRKLPVGWSPAPEGSPSDVYMWRKFFSEPWLRARTIRWPTAVSLLTALRNGEAIQERVRESERVAAILRNPAERSALRRRMVVAIARSVPLSRYPGIVRAHPLSGPPLFALKVAAKGYDVVRRQFPGSAGGSLDQKG